MNPNYLQKDVKKIMKILLIEDDATLCQIIHQELQKNGYVVDRCTDGESGILYALNSDYGYDLAIIDRMLPVIDGLTIIKAMRQKHIQIPVLIITGLSTIDERVSGLDSGADDYLIKPFHLRELLARVRALTRRPQQIRNDEQLVYNDLIFNCTLRKLQCRNGERILTAKEADLLSVFMQHPEIVFSKEQLILKVWGCDSDIEPGNVDNYISFLRKRLRELNSHCQITTLYGKGYQLENSNA